MSNYDDKNVAELQRLVQSFRAAIDDLSPDDDDEAHLIVGLNRKIVLAQATYARKVGFAGAERARVGGLSPAALAGERAAEAALVAPRARLNVDWEEVDADITKDPRRKNLGPRFLTDADMSTILDIAVVNDEDRLKYLGCRRIDPTMSGLFEHRHHRVIQEICKEIFLGPKMPEYIRPNDDGTFVRLVAPSLLGRPPLDGSKNCIIVIYGRAQGGKSPEGTWACWLGIFCLGVQANYYVRDQGGLGDATEVMDDFELLNEQVDSICRRLAAENPLEFNWLESEAERKKFQIAPKYNEPLEVEVVPTTTINLNWDEPDTYCIRLAKPQVIVSLANRAHMEKMMNQDGDGSMKSSAILQLPGGGSITRAQMNKLTGTFSPFSLTGGRHGIKHSIRTSGRGGRLVGRPLTLHSAYPAFAWDPDQPFDTGRNTKRVRMMRLLDEIDKTRSDKATHVQRLAHDDRGVADKLAITLEPTKHAERVRCTGERKESAKRKRTTEDELVEVRRQREALEKGDDPSAADPPAEAQHQRGVAAARRAAGIAAPQRRVGGPNYADESDPEDAEGDADTDEDDDETLSVVSQQQRMQQIAEQLADVKQREVELERELAEEEECLNEWREAEEQAMQGALGITGQQSAVAFNIGITATTFSTLHPNDGSKTVVRLVKMPVPDAYNDLCAPSADHGGELRMLMNPDRPAGPGDIAVVETEARPIRELKLRKPGPKNDFFSGWLVRYGHVQLDLQGRQVTTQNADCEGVVHQDVVPQLPLLPRSGLKRSYRLRAEWKDRDDASHIPAEHGFIADMVEEYERAKTVAPRRNQNTWERNGDLLTRFCRELQNQRRPLSVSRRVAQGLVINNETREVKRKDKMIADMFVRGGADVMQDLSCYNFSCNGIELYLNPETVSPEELIEVLDNPEAFREDLREYLRGDSTVPRRKLAGNAYLDKYINRMTQLASMCSRRKEGSPTVEEKPTAKKPATSGQFWYKEQVRESRSGLRNDVVHGQCRLITFNFPTCKLPKYMATLFTLLDARRHATDDSNLPLPFVGMTKTVGGRAKRYMCHGYRSRIQVMCHTTDNFPDKKLGLAMSDAIQEAFREAGFDDVSNFGRPAWMRDWVRQVYVTTQDFIVLLRNALVSQEELMTLLNDDALEDEEPMAAVVRVIADYQMEAFRICRALRRGEVVGADGQLVPAREPTHDDLPPAKYPNLFTWMTGHVNRSNKPFLRHSTLDASEEMARDRLEETVRDAIRDQYSDELEAQVEDGVAGEEVDEDGDGEDEDAMDLDERALALAGRLARSIPLPNYSEHHAPGGTLAQRDLAEQRLQDAEIEDVLQKREELQVLYTAYQETRRVNAADRVASVARKDARDSLRARTLIDMWAADWPPSGDDGTTYTNKDITEYKAHIKAQNRPRRASTLRGARAEEDEEHAEVANAHVCVGKPIRLPSQVGGMFGNYEEMRTELRGLLSYPGPFRQGVRTPLVGNAITDCLKRVNMLVTSVLSSRYTDSVARPDSLHELLNLPRGELKEALIRWHVPPASRANARNGDRTTGTWNDCMAAYQYYCDVFAAGGAVPMDDAQDEEA